MNGGEVAAIIGALATFVGTIFTTWRLARTDRIKTSSDGAAVLISGWENFQARTLQEVERVRKSCQEEIDKLKAEHEQDRIEWRRREGEMQEEIDTLKAQVVALIEASARRETQKDERR